MTEQTPGEKAMTALESAHHELTLAKIWRARAADAMDRAKADYDKATDKEHACQSNVDAAREKMRKILVPALEAEIKAR